MSPRFRAAPRPRQWPTPKPGQPPPCRSTLPVDALRSRGGRPLRSRDRALPSTHAPGRRARPRSGSRSGHGQLLCPERPGLFLSYELAPVLSYVQYTRSGVMKFPRARLVPGGRAAVRRVLPPFLSAPRGLFDRPDRGGRARALHVRRDRTPAHADPRLLDADARADGRDPRRRRRGARRGPHRPRPLPRRYRADGRRDRLPSSPPRALGGGHLRLARGPARDRRPARAHPLLAPGRIASGRPKDLVRAGPAPNDVRLARALLVAVLKRRAAVRRPGQLEDTPRALDCFDT